MISQLKERNILSETELGNQVLGREEREDTEDYETIWTHSDNTFSYTRRDVIKFF